MRRICRFYEIFCLGAFILFCAGCGGGDTNEVFEDIFGPEFEASISLTDVATGRPTDTVMLGSPVLVTVRVRDNDGDPVAGATVRFITGIARFNPESGTALTNAEGIATIQLLDDGVVGADVVTAEVLIGGIIISASRSYQVVAPDIRFGSGEPFVDGVLEIGVSPVSAGGTSIVTARLINPDGTPFTTQVSVEFTSPCVRENRASLDSPVLTINGAASSVYTALGCIGSDVITATVDISGRTFTATGLIEVLAGAPGSIRFVSATAAGLENVRVIALRGTGGINLSESATLTFRVLNIAGQPLSNQLVRFALNTEVGGLQLSVDSAISNANGEVSTVVQSGTVATSVRVTATVMINGVTISTQSDLLAVTTGIPDQDSFSISAETLNPEALNFDGVEVPITVRLADHFNNPVPDGTVVTFTTEGGSIVGSCLTGLTPSGQRPIETTDFVAPGTCTVDWTSQQPRPADGRVTILATAIGNESFTDMNGNGEFDSGEFDFQDFPVGDDLPGEAFRDDNEDGIRNDNEFFLDFNNNGVFDGIGDDRYNGVLCRRNLPDCTPDALHIRGSIVLVMAGSNAVITTLSPTPINLTSGQSVQFSFSVSDVNGGPMPAGTQVEVTTSIGMIVGPSSFTVPNTNVSAPTLFSVVVAGGDQGGAGALTISVTTPLGVNTTLSVPVTVVAPPMMMM